MMLMMLHVVADAADDYDDDYDDDVAVDDDDDYEFRVFGTCVKVSEEVGPRFSFQTNMLYWFFYTKRLYFRPLTCPVRFVFAITAENALYN